MYPIYAFMFKDNGLSDIQISLLFIIWSIAVLIFQIPFGVLSNKINRKYFLMSGIVFKALAFIIWILFSTFWGYAVGFILWGINWAIDNSTFEAFVYEELKNKKEYGKITGISQSIRTLGYAISLSCGTLLLDAGYNILTYLSVLSLIISIITLSTIKYNQKIKTISQSSAFCCFQDGLKTIFKSKELLCFIIMMYLIIGATYIDEYYNLITFKMGVPKKIIGPLLCSIILCDAFGRFIAHKFEKFNNFQLYLLSIFCGLTFGSVFFSYNLFGIILIALSYILFSIARTLFLIKIQHATNHINFWIFCCFTRPFTRRI